MMFVLVYPCYIPGGPHLRYVLTCVFKNSQKRVSFSEWGSDLSRSEKRVSFLANLGNKGTFSLTLFIVWSYFGIFLANCSCCHRLAYVFMLPFRDKGTILLLILLTYHAQILALVVHLWDKGEFLRERLRKGCDSSIKNFRDMGAF